MTGRIQCTTFSEEDLQGLIADIVPRFTDGEAVGGNSAGDRGTKLHDMIRWRRAHFHALPSVDPVLSAPFDQVRWQTDLPRRVHSKLKARLCENDAVTRVHPARDIEAQRAPANDLEAVFAAGSAWARERTGIDLQADMADGQIIDGLAILHTCMAEKWPKAGEAPGRRAKKEAHDAYAKQRQLDQAEAGWPWWEEVVDPLRLFWIEDKSVANGMGMVLDIQTIGLLSYARDIGSNDLSVQDGKVVLSVHDVNKDIPIYEERETPTPDQPSYTGMNDLQRVAIAKVWTRDEYYELVTEGVSVIGNPSAQGWKLIRSFRHPYEQPPYFIVPAVEVRSSDPALRYEPLLEGVFRQKPQFDRNTSLFLAAGEQNMLPWYYWESTTPGGGAFNDENGEPLIFQRNSALAEKAPEGYTLKMVPPGMINPAMIEGRRFLGEEMEKSAPSTGVAEVSASTQPWAIRLQQAQESVEPGRAVKNQSLGLTAMRRVQALVMSKGAEDGGFGEPVWVYRRSDNGAVDGSTVVGVEPEQIRSLNISTTIDATTSAERVTLLQIGREQMADPFVKLKRSEYIEEYEGKPNADELAISREVDAYKWQTVVPKFLAAAAAEALGKKFILAANGVTIDGQGQQVPPGTVLQQNGWQPQMMPQPQQPVAPQPAPMVAGGQAPQPSMPQNMAPLAAPGTIPVSV